MGQLRWHAKDAVPALIELAVSDPDARQTVVDALGRIGQDSGVKAVSFLGDAVIDDTDEQNGIAPSAAHALGRTRLPEATRPLLAVLSKRPPTSDTALAALHALGSLGRAATEAVPFLSSRLSTANAVLGDYVEVLERLGSAGVDVQGPLRRLLDDLPPGHVLRPVVERAVLPKITGRGDALEGRGDRGR